jgi:50S ribosomal protein L16 3-hydroxylase
MKQPPPLTWPVLGKISQKEFLSKYWQKKPVLLRGALKPFPEIITPDEVAGLSCDSRVESRLILEKGGKTPWELSRGPFKPSLFSKLPKSHWTILVNGVDRFVPGVQGLLDHFSFIPFWRIDDVMISVAYDKGNVGAHVDNYDVFLVQGAGTREWLIEDKPNFKDEFVPGLPIRLLKKFKPTHRWVLEPGDILYLPPRFPHHGIAKGDRCMTISVGFRAPSMQEIIHGVTNNVLEHIDEGLRYSDPDLKPQAPGEISQASISKMKAIIRERLLADDRIEDWLGRYVSETYPDVKLSRARKPLSGVSVRSRVSRSDRVVRAEGARFAFIAKRSKNGIAFFADSERHELEGKAAELGKLLANSISLPARVVTKHLSDSKACNLLAALLQRGLVVLE